MELIPTSAPAMAPVVVKSGSFNSFGAHSDTSSTTLLKILFIYPKEVAHHPAFFPVQCDARGDSLCNCLVCPEGGGACGIGQFGS